MQQSVASPDFLCEVQPDRDRVIVRLVGDLDLAVADRVAATLSELLDVGFTNIVIDLRRLSFIDSSGVHVFDAARRSMLQRDGRIAIIAPRHVQRVFELTAHDHLFTFCGPEMAA